MANTDVKQLAKENGVYLWQVAEKYGVTDVNFSRKLRHELPEKEKVRIRQIINDLKAGEETA